MGANLQTVELDEDDGVPAEPPTRPSRRPQPRRRTWALVAGVAVLVGGLGIAQHVVDARRAAHAARFDRVPGVVLPLQAEPARLWDWPPAATVAGEVAGRVVTARVDGDGVVEAHARATGRTVWTTWLTLPEPSDADAEPGLACRPLGTAHGRVGRLVCVLSPDSPATVLDRPEEREIVVLDGDHGHVVADWTTQLQVWGVAGDLVVTASAAGDATHAWTVTANRGDGAQAWTRTLDAWHPYPLPADGGPGDGVDGDAGHVLLSAEGHAALLDARGAVLRTLEADGTTGWSLTRAGALVRQAYVPVSDGTGGVTVDATIDAPHVPATTTPVWPTVDDGSAGGVLLGMAQDGLTAYDAASGRRLWSDDTSGPPDVVLGGRAYVLRDGSVAALDLASGREAWHADVPGEAAGVVFTDGRVLYVPTSDAVEAYALDDGTRAAPRPLGLVGPVAEGVAGDYAGTVDLLAPQVGVVTLAPRDGDGTFAVVG